MCRSFSIIFVAIAICKKWEKEKKEERREPQTKQRTKNEKPMRSFFLLTSAILFSSVLVHLCVVNSTINEWSDSLVVCATSCEVTQIVRGPSLKRWRFGPTRGNKGLTLLSLSLTYEKQFWLGRTEQKRVKLDENEQRVFCLWLSWQRDIVFQETRRLMPQKAV